MPNFLGWNIHGIGTSQRRLSKLVQKYVVVKCIQTLVEKGSFKSIHSFFAIAEFCLMRL